MLSFHDPLALRALPAEKYWQQIYNPLALRALPLKGEKILEVNEISLNRRVLSPL